MSLEVIIAAVGALATIITVIIQNNQVKRETKNKIDEENRQRTIFETETKMTLKLHNEKISELTNDVKDVKTELGAFRREFDEFKGKIEAVLFNNQYGIMSQKQSPRVLSKVGQEVFDEIVGKEFFDTHKAMFIEMIEAKKPQTALDVETEALAVVTSKISDPMFNPIKNRVYNYPEIEVDTDKKFTADMNSVCIAISIPLRDEYLKRHPEVL